MKFRSLLHFFGLIICTTAICHKSTAQLGSKYYFNFITGDPLMVAPGEVCLTWQPISTVQGVAEVSNTQYLVSVMDLFEDELWSDTVSSPLYVFNINRNDNLILGVTELGGRDQSQITISARADDLPTMPGRIDSLNYSLFHGHYLHAAALLGKMQRHDLITRMAEQYDLMFKRYAGSKMFNSYFDPLKNDLVQMPYIQSPGAFLQMLRKGMKSSKFKGTVEIHATLGKDDKVVKVKTVPPIDESLVQNALQLLPIDCHGVADAQLVVVVKSAWPQWRILNKRALTDPRSSEFERQMISPTGAVHR